MVCCDKFGHAPVHIPFSLKINKQKVTIKSGGHSSCKKVRSLPFPTLPCSNQGGEARVVSAELPWKV